MQQTRKQLWLRGLCWLLVLAPFFFLTYIPVNQYTTTRTDVGVLVYSWEHLIPF